MSKKKRREAKRAAFKKHCKKRNKLHQRYSMNERFPDSNKHHVSKETVIFIPTKLHRSVSHNIWNGDNMDKINSLAFEWFYDEWRRANEVDISNLID